MRNGPKTLVGRRIPSRELMSDQKVGPKKLKTKKERISIRPKAIIISSKVGMSVADILRMVKADPDLKEGKM